MGLQNNESSYIQAVSNRWDIALPAHAAAVTPSATPFTQEAALYVDDADTLTLVTAAGETVTMTFAAGFIPVRVLAVTAQTGTANIHRLW